MGLRLNTEPHFEVYMSTANFVHVENNIPHPSASITVTSTEHVANENRYFNFVTTGRTLKVKKLAPNAILPTQANVGDLGYDLYALEDVEIFPGQVTKVRTGIACGFPP